ncbi:MULTISPECIES: hypothetical protein [unclassified Moorena]|uniref:hypothetical protein n=1 Tax=unclassified Moorena TaxID=2683338 RepID=UPI0013FF1C12|nr:MULTISPECIES: hypothetical protein [unclassified Moorena]NEO15138.1 hypothetical protein [Moorena sp. SIO3E8]NEQ01214.1 hypothetical protein [Moorena sp. SIO3F7]
MKRLKKISAGLVLSLGILLLTVPVVVSTRREATSQDKVDALGSLIVGIPATFWGIWLAWRIYRQEQKEVFEHLQSTFYRLIQDENGRISVLKLAIAAKLPIAVAQDYLDHKARECDATFEVSEEGKIFYNFTL